MNMKRTFKFLTKIALLLMLVCTCFAAAGCESETKRSNTQNTWSRIKRNKKVTLGIDETFVPFGFQNKKGKIVGYDLDVAKAVFKPYGIKTDVQPIDWTMNMTELRNRTIDLCWNGFTATPQRARTCDFTRPYMKGGYTILSLKKNGITKMSDLKGQKVGVQGGSSDQQAINQKPKAMKDFIYKKKPILYGKPLW